MTASFYRRRGKRLLDLALTLGTAPVWVPVALAVAALVRVRLGTPVLFRQTRPGLDGEPFELIKFRSMTDARAGDGTLLDDAMRLTRFGRLLRASSLDELPSLWCVLRGRMSLVGPRPLLTEYLDLYTPEQARRHEVRPGLTGLAQVGGRNAISWEEKFALDLAYVRDCSLRLDARILAATVAKVLRSDGISAPGEATMARFTGTPSAGATRDPQAASARPRPDRSSEG